ncbi:nucleotidyl transferase AbiEii/AbiGii toxin family protein [Singulisphaera sp. PoT]|uniref:nucleotidyl transferase AbiEii/AbiGii toxin family protein n=1 Tax=Singulisphaera sp. PoT TaxID=3411797 RepID=UPI003BF558C0
MPDNLWRFLKRLTGGQDPPTPGPSRSAEAGSPPDDPWAPNSPVSFTWDLLSKQDLPRSYRVGASLDGAVRPRRFDPALLHFPSAFRPGDPEFPDEATGRGWAVRRRLINDHVLRLIAESELGDHLILRGSRLLKAWLGDHAREPGDLDWVSDLEGSGLDPESLIHRIVDAVTSGPAPEEITLGRESVATDEIWTYERTPGRRVVFPWWTPGLPGGTVQVDVTFGERLAEPDTRVSLPVADGGCVSVRAASRAQSLAWKILWLWTDIHAQGKDLYDAVLLAERCSLSRRTLDETFRNGGEIQIPADMSIPDFVSRFATEWDHFIAEYPWVEGEESHWMGRLERALGPVFGAPPAPPALPEDPNPIDPAWLTPEVIDIARGIVDDRGWQGLMILADALEEAGCARPDILDHCQNPGPHSRGCWVVAAILQHPGRGSEALNNPRTNH